MIFTLIDDGTLDTVLECSGCGREERFTFAGFNDGMGADAPYTYDEFVSWAQEQAASDHECYETD